MNTKMHIENSQKLSNVKDTQHLILFIRYLQGYCNITEEILKRAIENNPELFN